jgi:hypothetical protein
MYVGGIFSDFVNALDCVHGSILFSKLHFYDIQGTATK